MLLVLSLISFGLRIAHNPCPTKKKDSSVQVTNRTNDDNKKETQNGMQQKNNSQRII